MLSDASVRRAVKHLAAAGDTDLFPLLPEARFFSDHTDVVANLVASMNPGNYDPISSMEVLTPKSALGFRIGHQLTAADSLIYTAAVIESAEGIENIRRATSGDAAFAYRYDPAGEERLFLEIGATTTGSIT